MIERERVSFTEMFSLMIYLGGVFIIIISSALFVPVNNDKISFIFGLALTALGGGILIDFECRRDEA